MGGAKESTGLWCNAGSVAVLGLVVGFKNCRRCGAPCAQPLYVQQLISCTLMIRFKLQRFFIRRCRLIKSLQLRQRKAFATQKQSAFKNSRRTSQQ